MIRATDLKKIYRTEEVETTALHNVNMEAQEGEFLAIMGPSGCGKSTLLNLLGLLDTPTGGRYYLMGEDTSNYTERQLSELRKRSIGLIFQNFNLIDDLTVYENVELPLLYLRANGEERRERVNEVLDQIKMGHRKKHFPQQLSGGQQQRVAVARAIVSRPKLVLADEPTGNLDSQHGEDIMGRLTELNEAGTTIIMVTHAAEYSEYCHRTVHLFDGKIVAENIHRPFVK